MKKTNLISVLSIVFLIYGCQPGSSPDVEKKSGEELDSLVVKTISDADTTNKTVAIISAIMSSIPSPIEMALIVKSSGAPFSKSILNDPSNSKEYSTNSKRAINLGVYGADLGYANLYKQNTASLEYIRAVKSLADELKIGQFFDLGTLQKLSENKDDAVELINVTQSSFNDINNYLQEQERANISVAILIGGWIEALYLSTEIAGKKEEINKELLDGIGYQKIILQDLILLLDAFQGNKEFEYIEGELRNIQEAYENVSITYEEVDVENNEPMVDEDGIMIVQSSTRSRVNITSEDLQKISSKVKSVRAHIIN